MASLLFYLLSIAAVGFGAGVVVAKSPLSSVLSLLGTFLCLGVIYLLAGFQFLAAAQILVYAGAIMVLFLFVIMLLNLGDLSALAEHPARSLGKPKVLVSVCTAGALAVAGLFSAGFSEVQAADPELLTQPIDDIESIAALLFSRYMVPFEAAGMLLLVTMVGVIVLAKRQRGAAEVS